MNKIIIMCICILILNGCGKKNEAKDDDKEYILRQAVTEYNLKYSNNSKLIDKCRKLMKSATPNFVDPRRFDLVTPMQITEADKLGIDKEISINTDKIMLNKIERLAYKNQKIIIASYFPNKSKEDWSLGCIKLYKQSSNDIKQIIIDDNKPQLGYSIVDLKGKAPLMIQIQNYYGENANDLSFYRIDQNMEMKCLLEVAERKSKIVYYDLDDDNEIEIIATYLLNENSIKEIDQKLIQRGYEWYHLFQETKVYKYIDGEFKVIEKYVDGIQ